MTCIVGVVYQGNTYIGGDSMGSTGWSELSRRDLKVFHLKNNPDFIVGYCGSFRLGHLIQYSTTLVPDKYKPRDKFYQKIFDKIKKPEPELNDFVVNHETMVTQFIPKLQELLSQGGNEYTSNGVKEMEGSFLIGYKGQLFNIESDYQVGIPAAPFDTCGSGAFHAGGAMHVLYGSDGLDIEGKIVMALGAAEAFAAGVGGPFHIVSTAYDGVKTYTGVEE